MSFGKIRSVFSPFLTFRTESSSHAQGQAHSSWFFRRLPLSPGMGWEGLLDLVRSGQRFTHGSDVESGLTCRIRDAFLAPRHEIDGSGQLARLVSGENDRAMPVRVNDVAIRHRHPENVHRRADLHHLTARMTRAERSGEALKL